MLGFRQGRPPGIVSGDSAITLGVALRVTAAATRLTVGRLLTLSGNNTALTSQQPISSACSVAGRKASYPCSRPTSSGSAMARLPTCLPRRCCSAPPRDDSKLAGQRPGARHCSRAVEPAVG
jgi:hypothetical protein